MSHEEEDTCHTLYVLTNHPHLLAAPPLRCPCRRPHTSMTHCAACIHRQ